MKKIVKPSGGISVQPEEKRKRGRPPGSKNKKTLLREAYEGDIMEKMQAASASRMKAVVEAVTEQALNGCIQSQKILLDRWWPASKAVDGERQHKPDIHINILPTGQPMIEVIEHGKISEEADSQPKILASRQSSEERPSAHVFTLHDGAKGSSEGA